MKQGLFYSRVANPDGVAVSYPGRPYHPTVKIYPGKDPLIMDIVFKAYNGRQLTFIKEIKSEPKRQHQSFESVSNASELKNEPKLDSSLEIQEKESDIESLLDRSHEDANQELQKLAYEIDPMRKSKGFTMLRDTRTTKKEIFDFIADKRNLHARWDETVTKDRWISIAMHGYTAEADRNIFKYNTRKLAETWHTKAVLKSIFKSKGAQYDPRLKVSELFEYAWNQGWLARDPHEVMDGALLPEKEES
jgi:hypothetical protein